MAAMRERGFSLVELLVALMILTLVITSSLAVFVERRRRLEQAAETVLAYQALSNEAEYRRREPFKDFDPDDPKFDTNFLSDTSLLDPLKPFAAVVKAEELKTGVCNVTMTIRWHNGQREAKLIVVRADTGGEGLW